MIIEINDDGLFQKSPEKIMYVPFNKTILFTYIGKKYAHCTPLLLTNYNNQEGKQFQINENEATPITLARIYTEFNYIEGNYEINLNWSCKIHFNHSGLYFFQIIFIDKKHDDEARRLVRVPPHFEYLIVNPTYTGYAWTDVFKGPTFDSLETLVRNNSALNLQKSVSNCPINSSITKRINSFAFENDSLEIKPTFKARSSILDAQFGSTLNFDTMSIMTLFPTMMGPIDEWEEGLEYLIDRGFHSFHFSPIQQLGKSGSLFSLLDQLTLNTNIFDKEKSFDRLIQVFNNLKLKHHVFFVIDIIWNHCSIDAQWILQEPSCYYSPQTRPSLNAAFEFDNALKTLSTNLLSLCLLPQAKIETLSDIDNIMSYISCTLIPSLKLEEFFQIDITSTVNLLQSHFDKIESKELRALMKNGHSEFTFVDPNQVTLIKNQLRGLGSKRNSVTLDDEWLTDFISKPSTRFTCFEFEKTLKLINQQFLARTNEWLAEAVENIKQEIIERFIHCNVKNVTNEYSLVQEQFHLLANGEYALLNGMIKDNGTFDDSDMDSTQFYLRRKVTVWADSIKLYYQTPKECPNLWNRMDEYTKKMALIFDGFRLHDFHSTNLETAKFFINNAIRVNESLFLFSELFSSSPKVDVNICLKVGVHRLARELQNCQSLTDILTLLQDHFSDATNLSTQIPALCENNYEITYLKPSKPLPIIYDQTSDNPSYFQRYNIYVQLPILALENFVSIMIGTNRGFDELFTHNIPNNCTKRYPRLTSKTVKVKSELQSVWFVVKQRFLGLLISSQSRLTIQSRVTRVLQ